MKIWMRTLIGVTLLIWTAGSMGCYAAYKTAKDERSVGMQADDTKLANQVKYRLLQDEIVKGLDITVHSYLQTVYLIGAVEDDMQRSRAIEIAKGVPGVNSVKTYFLSKSDKTIGKTVDDSNITAKVKIKMIQDKEMKSTQISVKTILGHVVLLGVVGNTIDRDKAIAHAKSVEHVRKVKSFLVVY